MGSEAEPERPAHYVRAWRKHVGLTQRRLAEDVDTSFQNMSNIEAGRTRLTGDMAEAIARRLGITTEMLRAGPPGADAGLEADLLVLFRDAKVKDRRLILDLARAVVRARRQDGETE